MMQSRNILTTPQVSNKIRHESNFEEEITASRPDAASGTHCPILTLSYCRCWLLACIFYGGWKPFIVIAEKNENEIEWLPEELDEGAALMAATPIPPSYDASAHGVTCTTNSTRTCTPVRFCLFSVYIYRFLTWCTVYDDSCKLFSTHISGSSAIIAENYISSLSTLNATRQPHIRESAVSHRPFL